MSPAPASPALPDLPVRLERLDTVPEELHSLELEQVLLEGLDLSGRDARGLRLVESRLERVELAGAKLRGAIHRDVAVSAGSWANLAGESLALVRVEFRGTRLTGASFANASLEDVVFSDCRVDLAQFRLAKLLRVRFEDCRLEEADFYNAGLASVFFSGCDLSGVSLAGMTVKASEMRNCKLATIGNPERLRGVRMPWPDVVQAADVLAAAVGIEIVE